MALNAAAERVEQRKPGPACSFGKILAELPADDRAWFKKAVDEGRQKTWILEVFKEDGHDVKYDAMRRHISGACSCL
jgi:hypothetical protein